MRTRFLVTTVGAVLTVGMLAGPTAIADDGARSVGAGAAATSRAGAAVVVGQTGAPVPCGPANTMWVQYATAAAPAYIVPDAGVITSFSHNANGTAGSIRAVVVGPAAAPNDRTVLGYSAQVPVTTGTLNTFAVRLPVPAGAGLGIHISATSMGCLFNTAATGDVLAGGFLDPSVSSNFSPSNTFPTRRLNLSAVWEPDVDHDLYGDVSQDACPQSASTQVACPAPATTITKQPAKRTSKREAKIKFSSVPGATFTCAVDGNSAKRCTSPFKKRYTYGKHTVLVTAISPVGIPDPTPATVKFKVVRQQA